MSSSTCFGGKNTVSAFALGRAQDIEDGEDEVVIKFSKDLIVNEELLKDADVVARQQPAFEDAEGRKYCGLVAIQAGILRSTMSQLLEQIEIFQIERLLGMPKSKLMLEIVLRFPSLLSPEREYRQVPQRDVNKNRKYFISWLQKELDTAKTDEEKKELQEKIKLAKKDPGKAQQFCLTNEKQDVIKVKILKRSGRSSLRLAGAEPEWFEPLQKKRKKNDVKTTPIKGKHETKKKDSRSFVKKNKFHAKVVSTPGSSNATERMKKIKDDKEPDAKKKKDETPTTVATKRMKKSKDDKQADAKEKKNDPPTISEVDLNFTCVSENNDNEDPEVSDYGCWTENAVLGYRKDRRRIVNVEKGIASIIEILSKREMRKSMRQDEAEIVEYQQMTEEEREIVNALIAIYFPLKTEEEVNKLFRDRSDLTSLLKKHYINTMSVRPMYLFPGKVMNQIFHPHYLMHHMYSKVSDGTAVSSRSSKAEGQEEHKKKISEHFKEWFSGLCSHTVEKLSEYNKDRFLCSVAKVPNSNLRAGAKRRNSHAVRSIMKLGETDMPSENDRNKGDLRRGRKKNIL